MAVKEKENNLGMLPQNIEAEEAVLGAILVNPNVITKVVEVLKPESFYKPAHRYIYDAMLQLFNSNERIDIVSVSDVLSYNSKLETIGGRAFVNDLCYKTITTSNIEYYAKIVQEKAIKRALINAGSEIVSFGYDVNPIDQSLDSAEKLIFDIASKKATSDLVHVKDLVLNTYEKIEYRYEHKDELTGVPTGFYELDAILNGLQKSDLIILAARPSVGKTSFALNIVEHVMTNIETTNFGVGFFSLEMSKLQLAERLISSKARISLSKIRSGDLEKPEWGKLGQAFSSISQSNLVIEDSSQLTIMEIRGIARQMKYEFLNRGKTSGKDVDLKLIVVDYLQLIHSGAQTRRNGTREQEIADISRGLKALAKELNVPVIALAQLSRAVEQRQDKPRLSDLRESGSIEQDADIVMFLHRQKSNKEGKEDEVIDEKTNQVEVILAKHRNGAILDGLPLHFIADQTRFENIYNSSES